MMKLCGSGGHSTFINGMAPIHRACRFGNTTALEMLVENGTSVELLKLPQQHTPLFMGAYFRHVDIVKYLLTKTNVKVDKPCGEYTPFMFSGLRRHTEVVCCFLEHAKNLEVNKRWENKTMLYMACENDDFEVVESFLRHGKNHRFDINARCQQYRTAFYLVCREGKLQLVKYFLKYADSYLLNVNVSCDNDNAEDGKTPLYAACEKGHEKVVHVLVQPGTGVDVNKLCFNQDSAVAVACKNGFREIVRTLIFYGANLEKGYRHRGKLMTPREIARIEGHTDIVELIDNKSRWMPFIRGKLAGPKK